MSQAELFWVFLEDSYALETLKKVNLEGFDWSSRSDSGLTVLVTCIRQALFQPPSKFAAALTTIEWLVRSGASVGQKCTGGDLAYCLPANPEAPHVKVQCKGRSAISIVRALQTQMRKNPKWKEWEGFLAKVLESFLLDPDPTGPRVSIHEGIAELWEKSLAAKDSHDLTIETADGLVTAHAHMVKAASPVIAAMLESPMKEGKEQRIEIRDASSGAVSLFLEMLGVTVWGCLRCCVSPTVTELFDW